MPYLIAEDLKSELGQPQEAVVWGQSSFPSEERVTAIITANEKTIDRMCRGRYTVPFSPVPEDITAICLSLCLGDLLPQVSNRPEQHERAARERKWGMDRLKLMQQGDDETALGSSGPIVVSTPATPRAFGMEDAY